MVHKIADFLVNGGLYGKGLEISKDDLDELKLFLEGEYKLEAYCNECKSERIFTAIPEPLDPRRKSVSKASIRMGLPIENEDEYTPNGKPVNVIMDEVKQNQYEQLVNQYPNVKRIFSCAMNEKHYLTFCCMINHQQIIKYGQYPSLADLNSQNLKKYRKILGDKYGDFTRGTGLNSHGIGAGSLVYLRRIFEDLIEEAHQTAKTEFGWQEEIFPNRMDEKIQALRNYLPDYLVENRKIYGVLSKGIHELPEDLCIEIFPIVKNGIELILDEKIEKKEREEKKKETAILIEQLSAKIEKESLS